MSSTNLRLQFPTSNHYTAQATKSVFHATINGYSSYYGCNHMVTVRITAVTIWLQFVLQL